MLRSRPDDEEQRTVAAIVDGASRCLLNGVKWRAGARPAKRFPGRPAPARTGRGSARTFRFPVSRAENGTCPVSDDTLPGCVDRRRAEAYHQVRHESSSEGLSLGYQPGVACSPAHRVFRAAALCPVPARPVSARAISTGAIPARPVSARSISPRAIPAGAVPARPLSVPGGPRPRGHSHAARALAQAQAERGRKER